jgi:hypothetical protein
MRRKKREDVLVREPESERKSKRTLKKKIESIRETLYKKTDHKEIIMSYKEKGRWRKKDRQAYTYIYKKHIYIYIPVYTYI